MHTEVSVSDADAVVTVTDNGPGIPTEMSNRVFEVRPRRREPDAYA